MTLRWTLDKVGAIARSATDTALVIAAMHGPDGHDETVSDRPFSWDGGSAQSRSAGARTSRAQFTAAGRSGMALDVFDAGRDARAHHAAGIARSGDIARARR
jgi:Asp-tRNA(Asn)/Glu-tRNA(Gln) amidotransferase A subunit family amidase